MKLLSSSQWAIACGLVLGVMVLWASAMPSVKATDSIIGGEWWPYDGCCSDVTVDICPNGLLYPGGPPMGCTGGPLVICVIGGSYECTSPGPSGVCGGSSWCASFGHAVCD